MVEKKNISQTGKDVARGGIEKEEDVGGIESPPQDTNVSPIDFLAMTMK